MMRIKHIMGCSLFGQYPFTSLKLSAVIMASLLLSVSAILILVVSVSSAATVSTTKTTMQAYYGVSNNIANTFVGQSQGFSVVTSNSAASTQPCTWISGGTCQTALKKNDYQYAVVLIVSTTPSLLTTYTVTMNWDLGKGSGLVQVGSLKISVPVTSLAGQSMTFVFDTGSSTYKDPQSIQISAS